MPCRGSFYALRSDEEAEVLATSDVDELLEIVDGFFDVSSEESRRLNVDKSWDAMHRVLTDGWLDARHGDAVLRQCVLGGRQLSDRNDWIISFVNRIEVPRVSAAILPLTQDWFRERYFRLHKRPAGWFAHRYEFDLSETDFEYTWSYFTDVRALYQRAADDQLSVLFLADQ